LLSFSLGPFLLVLESCTALALERGVVLECGSASFALERGSASFPLSPESLPALFQGCETSPQSSWKINRSIASTAPSTLMSLRRKGYSKAPMS
jgi:hypothetical protein